MPDLHKADKPATSYLGQMEYKIKTIVDDIVKLATQCLFLEIYLCCFCCFFT